MSRVSIPTLLLLGLCLSACHNNEILVNSIADTKGTSLIMTFNNSTHTTHMRLGGGKTISLKQERMASGILYTNRHYRYSNWHGQTRVEKDGIVVFSSCEQ